MLASLNVIAALMLSSQVCVTPARHVETEPKQDSLVQLDTTFFQKMKVVSDYLAKRSSAGPIAWNNADGAWIGISAHDTIQINAGSLADLKPEDIRVRVKQIEATPDVSAALAAAKWNPAAYVATSQVLSQTAMWLSHERQAGPAEKQQWEKRWKIMLRPDAIEFVRTNFVRLGKLGFPLAAALARAPVHADPVK